VVFVTYVTDEVEGQHNYNEQELEGRHIKINITRQSVSLVSYMLQVIQVKISWGRASDKGVRSCSLFLRRFWGARG
jgi:hypothetical protein